MDVVIQWSIGDFAAFHGREHCRYGTYAICTVTTGTDGTEDFLALGHQFRLAESLACACRLSELCALGFIRPDFEIVFGDGLDHDRHEAMALATKLGALTTVDARFIDASPHFVNIARNRILFPAQLRHPP